jgi:hypothetical protein
VADSVTPLCTPDQFQSGAFADLVRDYSPQALADVLGEATRMCEDAVNRRLAPFTGKTETQTAQGIDPDEYGETGNMPVSLQATLGQSYAMALGASDLVRHTWLDEHAVRYPELWTYGNVQVTIVRSYGGSEVLVPSQILNGPEPDTGHIWFQLGVFLPIGSRIKVSYDGGYTVAVPASLVRAGKLMAASIVVRELNPTATDHNPDELYLDAMKILDNWRRD